MSGRPARRPLLEEEASMQPLRMSRRVMNLAYMLTQNARRHGIAARLRLG